MGGVEECVEAADGEAKGGLGAAGDAILALLVVGGVVAVTFCWTGTTEIASAVLVAGRLFRLMVVQRLSVRLLMPECLVRWPARLGPDCIIKHFLELIRLLL